jgi:hypothetical protein
MVEKIRKMVEKLTKMVEKIYDGQFVRKIVLLEKLTKMLEILRNL